MPTTLPSRHEPLTWLQFCPALGVLGTFCAVIVALFGDRIRACLYGPRLQIEPSDDFLPKLLIMSTGEKRMYWYLRVRNRRPSSHAKNCWVELRKIERRGVDNEFREVVGYLPMNLHWPPAEAGLKTVRIADDRIVDFGWISLSDADAKFGPCGDFITIGFPGAVKGGEVVRYHLRAVWDDARPSRIFVVQVSWDGKRSESAEEMRRHVTMIANPGTAGAKVAQK